MDFSAGQELKLPEPCLSPVITIEQKILEQSFSGTVTFEEALVVLDDLLFAKIDRHLSEAEITVLEGAWNDCDYEEIAESSPYSLNYLQRRLAPKLWDVISETIGERVSKKKLRDFLQKVTHKKYQPQFGSNKEQAHLVKDLVQIIKGQPPDVSSFYGRTEELTHLKELIVKQRCISLIGVAGIGKSALAAKLIEELSLESQSRFDFLIWRSVIHAPPVQNLVADLIELIQPSKSSSCSPEYTQEMISVLINQLQSHRCLLVLDAADALFQKNNGEQRLEYGIFFRRLAEEKHQSCLLLTSQVLPEEFDNLRRTKRPVQYLRLEGLDIDAAMQLLTTKGLNNQEKCKDLIKIYCGNPLDLETVVERINHFFAGSTEKFFEYSTTFITSEFQEMLDQMFGHVLSQLQRQIMIYLAEEIASNRDSISFVKLLSDLNQKYGVSGSTSELVKALEKLEMHSLIETRKDNLTKEVKFTLQPVINKYIKTDPLGLVYTSDTLSKLAVAS